MACKFSCFLSFSDAFKENDVGVFHSDDGDVYRVKYKSNVCRDLLLKIEWTMPKRVLLTVKLHNTSFKRCFSSKGFVINGKKIFMKLRGAFNVSNSRDYKILCVVECIPYIKFGEFQETTIESSDSGFIESESLRSSHDVDKNEVIEDKTKWEKENTENNVNICENYIVKVCEKNIPGVYKVSESKIGSVNEEIAPNECNLELETNVLTYDVTTIQPDIISKTFNADKIENEMLVSTKNDNLKAYDQNGETLKNVYQSSSVSQTCFKSEQIIITTENNFEVNNEKLLNESAMQITEFVSSDDTSTDINEYEENNSRDALLNKKIFVVDIGDEEKCENININLYNDSQSNSAFSENNPSIVTDSKYLSSKDLSISYDEQDLLDNPSSKIGENCSSTRIVSKTNPTLTNNKCREYSLEVKSAINSESMEVDVKVDSDDFSMKDNTAFERDLTSIKKFSNIQNSDPLKIRNDAGPQTIEGGSSLISKHIQITSDVKENAEIDNRVKDSAKTDSLNLCSSKAGVVFQTLVRKLSVDDSDLELTGTNENAVISSEVNVNSELNSTNSKIFPIMESELKGLSMDMLDLLTSGDMADAIISNGILNIKVHKALVSARSSVLKKAFVKCRQDDLKYRAIVDIPCYIFEDVIIFLYVGLVYIKSTKMAQDLYAVAEKYCINDLIDICAKHIPE